MTANSLQNRVGSGNRWSRLITVLQRVQIKVEVGPEQGGQAAPVGVGEPVPPGSVAQHDLEHDRVHVGERGLDLVQRERGYLGVLLIWAREVARLAVEDVGVERLAWRLGRTSWLARPGLVIHAGCMPELAADSSEYTVLLRSRSGARTRRGYYMDVTDFPDGLGGQVQVRISTRWENLGLDYPLPRELWMAVR